MKIDDLAIPLLLVVVGALRVVPQLVYGGYWGAESTVAAICIGLGVLALAAELLRQAHGKSSP